MSSGWPPSEPRAAGRAEAGDAPPSADLAAPEGEDLPGGDVPPPPARRGAPPGALAARARAAAPGAAARLPRRRRTEALAALLPLAGLFLLMPPFVRVFAHDGRILGAPSVLVFLLAVWVVLILGARRLARRLSGRAGEGP